MAIVLASTHRRYPRRVARLIALVRRDRVVYTARADRPPAEHGTWLAMATAAETVERIEQLQQDHGWSCLHLRRALGRSGASDRAIDSQPGFAAQPRGGGS